MAKHPVFFGKTSKRHKNRIFLRGWKCGGKEGVDNGNGNLRLISM
jgi:hypothetical protein